MNTSPFFHSLHHLFLKPPLLYLPPPPFFYCALPIPLSSSLSPPARSFPRTACSQHPRPDWLLAFKGPRAPAEHMAALRLRQDAVSTAATSPQAAAHCSHIYNGSHAHAAASSAGLPPHQKKKKLQREYLTCGRQPPLYAAVPWKGSQRQRMLVCRRPRMHECAHDQRACKSALTSSADKKQHKAGIQRSHREFPEERSM